MTLSSHLSFLWVCSTLVGNARAFNTPSCTPFCRSRALSLGLNPTDVSHIDDQTVSSVLSTLTTATSAVAAKSSGWSLPFPWFHTEPTHIYATGKSLAPIDSEAVSGSVAAVKDYFIPTSSEDAARSVLENYAKAKEATGGDLASSSKFIQIDPKMPGVPVPKTSTYNINPEITRRELDHIARETDIYMRKIPQAMILYGLLDFFVLPASKEVMNDELEDDRTGVVQDFAFRSAIRLGVFAVIALATIFVENLTYHPV